MCRLLGLLAPQETSAKPWLVDSERSLLRQSNIHPDHPQRDGWGIGWLDDANAVHIQKGIGGAFEPREKEHYLLASGSARGRVVLGHLRHASNPMSLPREKLLGLANSQPFAEGEVMFVHNGSIPLPQETRKLLGPLDGRVKGVNDSEVLFWLMLKHYRTLLDPLLAYVQAQRDLVRVWNLAGQPGKGPYSGLNVIVTRGSDEMWAFCAYLGDHGTNLANDGQPYYEMSYQRAPDRLVVGSEPFDSRRADWSSLPNGEYLNARIIRGQIAFQTGEIPLAAGVPA